jgi:hypothetical protein
VAYNYHPEALNDSWIVAKEALRRSPCRWLRSLVLHKSTHFPRLSEVALRCRIDTKYPGDQELLLQKVTKNSDEREWVLTKGKFQSPVFSIHLRALYKTLDISLKHKMSVMCGNYDSAYYPIENDDCWFKRE